MLKRVVAEPRSDPRIALPAVKGAIHLDGVRFPYALHGPWTLDDINYDQNR